MDPRSAAIDAARTIVLAAQQLAPGASVVEIATDGIRVTIRADQAAANRPSAELLTPCERDLLDLLAAAPMPMTTSQILTRLAQAGKLHGEATAKRALARLTRAGLLLNSRRPPRGYSPPPASARLTSA